MKIPKNNPENHSIKRVCNNALQFDDSKDQTFKHSSELSPKQNEFAISAAKLLNKLITFCELPEYKGKKVIAQQKFTEAYNNKAWPEIYEVIGKRDVKTLLRWRKKYLSNNSDFRVLAPQYKTKKKVSITPEQADVLITELLKPNQPLISEAVRRAINYFEAKRFPHIRSANTYRRFLEDWKKENYADYVFYRQGEAGLDNKILPYIERDWTKVEVGDIIIMDGHVNNYEIINPFTGKPKRMMTIGAIDGRSQYLCGYEISPTENTQSIAVTIFRAILQLGKIMKIIYFDNGKAFGAKYFHGDEFENLIPLFQRLNIQVIFAKAYHGQSKPIEPFWGWMSELERMIPTYVGTSIEMQPARMHRGEFIHRQLYEKAMQNTTVDIWTAHKAMSWWLDQYHNRVKTGGHLKGKTPAEIFNAGRGPGINKQDLTFLMMETRIAKLYRKGIRMFSNWYWSEELFGKQIDAGDDVRIKYDILNRDSIYVYDKHGDLICEAKEVSKVHPAAGLLGSHEEQEEFKRQAKLKEHLKKSVTGEARGIPEY